MSLAAGHLNAQQLDAKLELLEQERTWSPRLISKLEAFISSAPDVDLLRVNPIHYAQERGLKEAEVLDLFLFATKIGLFEMDWHLVCPHCGFIVDSLPRMNQIHAHHVCPTCGSERDYDLDDYIQVAFTISPQVRDIQYHHPESLSIEDLYLNYRLSKELICPVPDIPTWRDVVVHVTKYLGYVEPGQTVRVAFDMLPGVLRATDSRACIQLSGTHDPQTQELLIPLRLANGRFQSDDPAMQPRSQTRNTAANQPVQFRYELEKQIPSGKVVIEIENQQAIKSALFIFNPGEKPTPVLSLKPSLSGKQLLTNQTFRDLFRSEVIRENETLAIKDITFLFTDLKGSTSMYDEIGDAKAYFLVHQHFDALRRVIRQHNGAIVKTIGDAVMAVFDTPIDAIRAALSMLDALNEFNATISQDLMLKVGIHCGHSMAVAVNEGNDYFGQNVNIAARVQALADCNEIYISSDVYDSTGVSEALSNHQVVSDEVQVRGFSETIRVFKISPMSPG